MPKKIVAMYMDPTMLVSSRSFVLQIEVRKDLLNYEGLCQTFTKFLSRFKKIVEISVGYEFLTLILLEIWCDEIQQETRYSLLLESEVVCFIVFNILCNN